MIIIVILLFILIFRLNSSRRKGIIGESIVAKQLDKLNNTEYKAINNLLVKTKKGTSQIDHVIVSIYGIFVIETKNYNGWIFGNENSEYWTQIIYKVKYKFRNPIKQNWAHIYALKEILSEYKGINYFPIIVFTGSSELKGIDSNVPVVYDHEVLNTVMDKIDSQNISYENMISIFDLLIRINIKDRNIEKDHVHNIKKNILVCPKCNLNLVLKNGRYGQFYGCPNYPNCKYTRNINK